MVPNHSEPTSLAYCVPTLPEGSTRRTTWPLSSVMSTSVGLEKMAMGLWRTILTWAMSSSVDLVKGCRELYCKKIRGLPTIRQ